MKLPQAQILQGAAIIVAAPRYMSAFAAARGIEIIEVYPWFGSVEIWSGAAMAIIEGWAIAFVFSRWRRMRVKSWQWKILLSLQLALMLALAAIAAPDLVADQLNEPVKASFPFLSTALLWLWSFLIAGIAPLVLAAVGYADAQPVQRASIEPAQSQQISKSSFACPDCPAGFETQQALNAHKRFCKNDKVRSDKIPQI